ncbi:MAG: ABC transporter permease [Oscillospiraceae bacterium]|nr:ABC transporter permease [Oscillospiraceae bacterium]
MTEQKTTPNQKKKRGQAGEVWHQLKKNKGAMIGLFLIAAIFLATIGANLFLDYEEQVIGMNVMERLQGPSMKHWMGTDDMGRDIFLRILYGAKYSLSVGVVAVLIAVAIGVPLGAFAGYFGGILEDIIMRVTDIFAAVPNILMAIVVVSALGQGMGNLMIAVGLCSIPQFVRITRASVLTVRDQEYVEAARAVGRSELQIIFGHVLPNCLSPIIVQTTLRIASAIITAAALSYLGLGVVPPAPEWGAMLSYGRNFIRGYSYMTLFPGLAIMITVLALNLLGDGLRDALDPKLRK